MEDIVINLVPSNTASPKDIVIDLLPTPPFTEATRAEFWWRWDDEPTSDFKLLGQGFAELPFSTPIDLMGRAIRISMIGISAAGVPSVTDPREGVQTTFTPNPLYGIVTHEGEVVTHEGSVVTYNG